MMIGTKLLNSFYVDNDLWEYWKGHIIIRTITRKITSKITKYGYFYRKSTATGYLHIQTATATIYLK